PAVIVTSYTPNIYAYNLAFSGRQFDYAAAVSVMLALATMVVAYIVQLISALTVAMFLALAYCLLPLVWLMFSATKSTDGLFSSFGLWFSDDFHLIEN